MARNNIKLLFTEEGKVLIDMSDIKREAVNFFQNFLQSQPESHEDTSLEFL